MGNPAGGALDIRRPGQFSVGANSLHDIGASVLYRLLSNAEVLAAYRRIRVDCERQGGTTIDSGPLFRMRLPI